MTKREGREEHEKPGRGGGRGEGGKMDVEEVQDSKLFCDLINLVCWSINQSKLFEYSIPSINLTYTPALCSVMLCNTHPSRPIDDQNYSTKTELKQTNYQHHHHYHLLLHMHEIILS